MVTAAAYGLVVVCGVLAGLLLVAVLGWRHEREQQPVAYLPTGHAPTGTGSPTPLFDQTANELRVWPDRWSAGDEGDVRQALRIGERGPELPRLRRVQ